MNLSSKKTLALFSIIMAIMLIPIVPVQGYSMAQADVIRDYWPTDGWLNATPQEQGMNEDLLTEMMDHIQAQSIRIDSISIVRNGYLVFDKYPRISSLIFSFAHSYSKL